MSTECLYYFIIFFFSFETVSHWMWSLPLARLASQYPVSTILVLTIEALNTTPIFLHVYLGSKLWSSCKGSIFLIEAHTYHLS